MGFIRNESLTLDHCSSTLSSHYSLHSQLHPNSSDVQNPNAFFIFRKCKPLFVTATYESRWLIECASKLPLPWFSPACFRLYPFPVLMNRLAMALHVFVFVLVCMRKLSTGLWPNAALLARFKSPFMSFGGWNKLLDGE